MNGTHELPGNPQPNAEPPSPWADARRRSRLRRRLAFVLVASALFPAAGIALWWDVAAVHLLKALPAHSELQAPCPDRTLQEIRDNFKIVPQDPAIADVDAAVLALVESKRYRIQSVAHFQPASPGDDDFKFVITRNEDAYRVDRRSFSVYVDPRTEVVHTPGSTVWIPYCSTGALNHAQGHATCVQRTASGDTQIVSWATDDGNSDPPTCGPRTTSSTSRTESVTLRGGRLVSVRAALQDQYHQVESVLTVEQPQDINAPWFLQQVPGWFVRWVAPNSK